MLCKKPFVSGGLAFPCGQCQPCRVNRRRLWSHRIMLESLCHTENAFLTLTYADGNLSMTSEGSGVATLVPEHLRDWLKRLRSRIHPLKLRFYAVGEYGEKTWRPHYHVILFGFQGCLSSDRRTRRNKVTGEVLWERCCDRCRLVGETWGFGTVDLGEVNLQSANYCAEYTVKKMTRTDDPRLNGQWPEFARMSLKPGIGADFMWDFASEMLRYRLDERLDVPTSVGQGKSEKALGRYLRNKLRLMLDKETGAPDEVIAQREEELRHLREAARASSENPSFKAQIVDFFEGRRANFDAKEGIFRRRREL